MGGMATGIYGQGSGFHTTIFEAHDKPGGQCTSWNRKGYVFDACIHFFGAGNLQTKFDTLWRELGVLPCEMVETNEVASALSPDGTYYHDYYNLEKLQAHLKQLSPADAAAIDTYIKGIKRFQKKEPFGPIFMGSFWEKLSAIPALLPLLKYFKYTLGTFAKRFKHPLLRKTFPLLHYSVPDFPLFLHLSKHAFGKGDIAWPRGGSFTVAKNMAARYMQLGGTIHYRQKVVKILTANNQACGVELEDGTRHTADFIVSNADGRKTIMQMLSGRYVDKKISGYCHPNPDDELPFSVHVFLGVKRDLSSYPCTLIMFLDKPEVIAGHTCDHLDMQIFGFDASMAPAGKGVIKVELFGRPSYFSSLDNDKAAYRAEKNKIAEQVITLLEKRFPGLREDVEVIDVPTLQTWERFMGGTQGYNNYPNKKFMDKNNVIGSLLGLNKRFTLPGLKNFFFAGSWVTSAGALFMNAMSGKTVVQKICKQCRRKFVKPS
jgi:phytoene dehydrogenase-like protein